MDAAPGASDNWSAINGKVIGISKTKTPSAFTASGISDYLSRILLPYCHTIVPLLAAEVLYVQVRLAAAEAVR
jgi:hypothetical protein